MPIDFMELLLEGFRWLLMSFGISISLQQANGELFHIFTLESSPPEFMEALLENLC